jgi:NADH dehydrogenase (ubiquinone) 1 alpha subcomplex subunit 5
MRQTTRLLARYLEPGAPTGLTGLWTHSTPRSTLLYLYSTTLDKLQAFPESSLYRKSVESLTKHRMALVEKTVPPGYDEWVVKAKKLVADNPEHFQAARGKLDGSVQRSVKLGGRTYIVGRQHPVKDVRHEEWDGEKDEGPELEGLRTEAERADQALSAERVALEVPDKVVWEPEPQLTAEQWVTRLTKAASQFEIGRLT